MQTKVLADRRKRPGTIARFIAMILVLVVVLSTGALIVGDWYRSTILSVDWYRPAIKNQSFQKVVCDSVMNEIAKEIDQSGIFSPILTQALEKVLTNERIDAFLDIYLVSFVEFLNNRSVSPLPADSAKILSDAFLSYVHDASQELGVPFPAFVEQQIVNIAIRIGGIAEKNIDNFTKESFVQLALLEKYHRILLWISQSIGKMILALSAGLCLLLLLYFKQIDRFFSHALLGVWLAGAVIGLPLLAVPVSSLSAYLEKTPPAIKPFIENLMTLAADHLKMISLTVLAAATLALVVLFVVRLLMFKKSAQIN